MLSSAQACVCQNVRMSNKKPVWIKVTEWARHGHAKAGSVCWGQVQLQKYFSLAYYYWWPCKVEELSLPLKENNWSMAEHYQASLIQASVDLEIMMTTGYSSFPKTA